jgi:branched-chain amino acid transport system substrate-binding protein
MVRIKALALLAVIASIAIACAPAPTPPPTAAPPTAAPAATTAPAANTSPIKIGLSAPLTGPYASVGQGYEWGVKLAIEDLGGKIAGRPIVLAEADDKCTPTDAVIAMRKLIDDDKVVAVIGPACSGATLASLPISKESKVVQIACTSSNPTIYDQLGVGGNDYGFRLNLDDLIIAKSLAGYIAQQSKAIFIVGQNNDFGRGGAQAYQDVLPGVGVKIVGQEFYDDGTSDFRPILSKIKQSGADSIMTFMIEADSAPFFRQMKEVGLKVTVYTRGGVTSPLFLDMTKDDPTLAEGALGASYWTYGLDPDTEARFQQRWNSPPTVHRMMAYYAMKLVLSDAIARAIAKDGDVTPDGVRVALHTTNIKGTPIGDINFDSHNQAYTFLTLDTIKNGKITLVKAVPSQPR